MKALIVEDERMARTQLARVLEANFPDIDIVGMTDSVESTVAFLGSDSAPDIIFMDVELLDGDCFEISRRTQVRAQVIMTTAYDSYAIKAFEAGSIDYLLKPIAPEALRRAVARARERATGVDVAALLAALGPRDPAPARQYKETSTVRCGDRIIPVDTAHIACFFSDNKANYLMTTEGEKYMVESTIEQLAGEVDPEKFFRISRGCIVHRQAIKSASKHFSGRLLLTTEPKAPFEMTVSRARVEDFLTWLG